MLHWFRANTQDPAKRSTRGDRTSASYSVKFSTRHDNESRIRVLEKNVGNPSIDRLEASDFSRSFGQWRKKDTGEQQVQLSSYASHYRMDRRTPSRMLYGQGNHVDDAA
jgi:hypothetical protein